MAKGGVMLLHRLYATAAVPVPARRPAHATCSRPNATAGAHTGAVASSTPQQVGHLRGLRGLLSHEASQIIIPAACWVSTQQGHRSLAVLLRCCQSVSVHACMHRGSLQIQYGSRRAALTFDAPP